MSNQDQDQPVVLDTSNQITFAQYSMLKGALSLESKGMKIRQGPLRPRYAKMFGLKPRAPHFEYIQYCCNKMNELYKLEHGVDPVPLFAPK